MEKMCRNENLADKSIKHYETQLNFHEMDLKTTKL